MKQLLEALANATKHLSLLDAAFTENYPDYKKMIRKLEESNGYKGLCREIYVGGKKKIIAIFRDNCITIIRA
ncbi:hypothetical protein [Dehalococcoides mccartyi]|jgi:hypothetical protein|uniref:hypothetical protein n=1 Tax=Dehalococcoides mccartyi TaxID=61435 RepID=UPI0026E9B058|nr:hypothetical protein [Dehalococcoides mccartyi]